MPVIIPIESSNEHEGLIFFAVDSAPVTIPANSTYNQVALLALLNQTDINMHNLALGGLSFSQAVEAIVSAELQNTTATAVNARLYILHSNGYNIPIWSGTVPANSLISVRERVRIFVTANAALSLQVDNLNATNSINVTAAWSLKSIKIAKQLI